MADGLCSKFEMCFSRQERQEHADLATRLAAIESKLTNQTVSTSTSQPCTSLPHAQTHHITKNSI